MEIKTVLVTGGAGFIGSVVARRLLERGLRVRILDNLSCGRIENVPQGAEFIKGDAANAADAGAALDGIDAVAHLAARVSVRASSANAADDCLNNVVGTARLLERMRPDAVKRFVFASSMAVYAEPQRARALKETDAAEPVSVYGTSKIAAERLTRLLCAEKKVEYSVLRLFNVYGPGQKYSNEVGVVKIALEKMKTGETLEIFGDGSQLRDYIFVEDAASAFEFALLSGAADGLVFNVGTGVPTSLCGLLDAVEKAAGRRLNKTRVPARPDELSWAYADTSIAAGLGFAAQTTLAQGLAITAKREGLFNDGG